MCESPRARRAQIQFLDRAANRCDSPPGRSPTRNEVRRQADRASPGAPAYETLEDPADRLAKTREILDIDPRGPPQPINGVRLMKLENQIVGPQARHVRGGIPALERIIEVVGQENRLQPGGLPDLPIPVLTIAIAQRHGRKGRRSSGDRSGRVRNREKSGQSPAARSTGPCYRSARDTRPG